jgi:hypothetical protein
MRSAERTRGVLFKDKRSEISVHGAIQKKTPYERLTFLENEFEGLCGLDQANLSRDHAQDADLTSGGHKFLLRRLGQHAS